MSKESKELNNRPDLDVNRAHQLYDKIKSKKQGVASKMSSIKVNHYGKAGPEFVNRKTDKITAMAKKMEHPIKDLSQRFSKHADTYDRINKSFKPKKELAF